MNFFGHAIVASNVTETSPAFVLGAMLPDFVAMLRIRAFDPSDERVRAGVALHHDTDSVFHANDSFVALSGWTTQALLNGGVGRGGARAVGHIGVELLLDRTLLPNVAGENLYFDALRLLASGELLLGCGDEDARRLGVLAGRIASYGSPATHSDPKSVEERLFGILRSRPRLRLEENERDRVVAVLMELELKVQESSARIMRAVYDAVTPRS